jgi:pimeloyl-ACP methyl ester carboxylesterase
LLIPTLLKWTAKTLRRLPTIATVAGAGWIGYSVFKVDHHAPVPRPVPGTESEIELADAGRVAVYQGDRDTGTPVVLVHGVHAAASAYDMRPLFTGLGWDRRVITFDLPGFGHSERSDRRYTPELMTDAVIGVLEKVAGEPVDLVALSLGAEYAAAAAVARPDLVRSLTLISPTGLAGSTNGAPSSSPAGASGGKLANLISNPILGQALYDLLVTKPSIRYFLGKSFVGEIDQGYEAFAQLTSHRQGARFAPLAFVTGQLFTPQVEDVVYRKVSCPVMVVYDTDPYSSFDGLPEVAGDMVNWRAVRIAPSAGLPHFELPQETTSALEEFWAGLTPAEQV